MISTNHMARRKRLDAASIPTQNELVKLIGSVRTSVCKEINHAINHHSNSSDTTTLLVVTISSS